MTRVHVTLACLLVLLGVAGCGGYYVGLSGRMMYANGMSNVAISPESSLDLMYAGRSSGTLPSDTSIGAFSVLTYSVYGDNAPGPVTRSAHVLVCELSNFNAWEFEVEGSPRYNEAYLQTVEKDGGTWTEHLLYQEAEDDWFSALWEVNGHPAPELWIGKRWSRTYGDSVRVLAEYREPMPEDVRIIRPGGLVSNTRLIFEPETETARLALKDFHDRADQAFSFAQASEQEGIERPVPVIFTQRPATGFNLGRLVGQARVIDRSSVWDGD